MARTITVNGTDRTAIARLGEWLFVESAYRGEVGMGMLVLDDTSGLTIPGMKPVIVDESAASPVRLFTGFTNERVLKRGPFKAGTDRQQDVTIYDLNTTLDDAILVNADSADRPQETDFQRIAWLLSTTAMTTAAYGTVTAGVVPNTNTVTMDAIDYRGANPRQVLEDCGQKAGKNYFLYRFGSGPLLYYDTHTNTNLTSGVTISDDPADVDNVTCFGARIDGDSVRRDPSDVYSFVRLRYKHGVAEVNSAATAASFRRREKYVTNMKVKTASRATEMAQKLVDKGAAELETMPDITVRMPAAYVNEIRAGHRVQVKLRHADLSAFTYRRVIRRSVQAAIGGGGGFSDVMYDVRLSFADNVLPSKYHGGTYVDEEQSNATDDDASVIIDRGGITVYNGAIAIFTDDGTTVVIDGSHEIFQIVSTGTIVVPKNTTRGDVKKSTVVNTGLGYDPVTLWTFKRPDPQAGSGDWVQSTPHTVYNAAGQVVSWFYGRAQVTQTNRTRVQAIKGTSRPPLASQSLRYYIFEKVGF